MLARALVCTLFGIWWWHMLAHVRNVLSDLFFPYDLEYTSNILRASYVKINNGADQNKNSILRLKKWMFPHKNWPPAFNIFFTLLPLCHSYWEAKSIKLMKCCLNISCLWTHPQKFGLVLMASVDELLYTPLVYCSYFEAKKPHQTGVDAASF